MKLILEGPEAAGKSTLAERLSVATGWPVIHRVKPKSQEEQVAMLESYVRESQSFADVIWDRCWYSEMVYGPVMRDQSYIGLEHMHNLERMLMLNGGALIIHCTGDTENLWSRSQLRGEEYITDFATLSRIKVGYEQLLHKEQHVVPVVRYELDKNMPWL